MRTRRWVGKGSKSVGEPGGWGREGCAEGHRGGFSLAAAVVAACMLFEEASTE